jgi:hypothetical protein
MAGKVMDYVLAPVAGSRKLALSVAEIDRSLALGWIVSLLILAAQWLAANAGQLPVTPEVATKIAVIAGTVVSVLTLIKNFFQGTPLPIPPVPEAPKRA